ncbi:MAG: polyketide cyclase [Deltaproteobacteria bacterium]|jgi:hypothetical protein|nr:polyketide cyclase [Deltaproteobacteria bacterium]
MATTVRAAAPVPLPIETCWENLRDLSRARDYVPGLSDCVISTVAKEGLGASRVVTHKQFGDMDETVIAWDEGKGMTVRLHKGDGPARPFKEGAFGYEFRPAGEYCEIHTSLTYELPGGPLGRLIDWLVLRRVFSRNVQNVAVCLAENYRTGEPVPESEIPRLRANLL